MIDQQNDLFCMAAELVSYTNRHVFLTGKAGTGKTTFLKHIKEHCRKSVVVVAPTGVAAINAGGTTIHSLFQLGFEPFIPDRQRRMASDPSKSFRMGKAKIEVLKAMELLIIDEVSMLRADVLDAIDDTLQRYRGSGNAFGGVQVLYIGDLHQLPPVVGETEWQLLNEYYPSPFFFHSKALERNPPLYVELKKIYRQSDQLFIDVLNRVRHSALQPEDMQLLNSLYKPTFRPNNSDGYILLSTHNYRADQVNREELNALSGRLHQFEGRIEGEFSEAALPTELMLQLKVGAQVMFIKNDVGDRRRYYNGKLATVTAIDGDSIRVKLAESDVMLTLEKETWQNVRYVSNPETGKVEEELLGSFSQYPIRLAWAITIHKSQGLTFSKVIIDAGQAFAAGQVYVALSRCTTLNGIVLHSKIVPDSVLTDTTITSFADREVPLTQIQSIVAIEKPSYCASKVLSSFNFSPLVNISRRFTENLSGKKLPNMDKANELANMMAENALKEYNTAQKFQQQLIAILQQVGKDGDLASLKERVQKAADYFYGTIGEGMLKPIQAHVESLKKASKVKQYLKNIEATERELAGFIRQLQAIHYGETPLVDVKRELPQAEVKAKVEVESKIAKEKVPKGQSAELSLELFNEGKSIAKVAQERNLAVSTVEGHLVNFVRTGKLSAHELVGMEKLEEILLVLDGSNETSLTKLRELVGSNVSYLELKTAIAYRDWVEESRG